MTATSASTSPDCVETLIVSPQSIADTGELRLTALPSSSASASASRWLPPAMLGDGSSSMCATPLRSAAATRSAVVAHEISTRARIASRAPAGMSIESRSPSALSASRPPVASSRSTVSIAATSSS
jgi:hypothetical protein